MKKQLYFRRFALVITSALLASLAVTQAEAQIPAGTWYCIEAVYDDSSFNDFEATFSVDDAEYYTAHFEQDFYYGDSNTLYEYSATGDTFTTQMPQTISLSGGASSSSGGKRIYRYSTYCTEEFWNKAGQVALGWGFPEGASASKILFSVSGDTLLVLKSLDQKIKLYYTLGAKRPKHNPVIFAVNMKVQQQLGNFNPAAGDRVVARGMWSTSNLDLQESGTAGVYQATVDFPGSKVGMTYMYKFVILKSGGGETPESDPSRSFTVEGYGNNLGIAYFDRRARADVVTAFPVTQRVDDEHSPGTAYNPERDEFLVVWENLTPGPLGKAAGAPSLGINGQLVKSDGTLSGSPFSIASGSKYKPDVAYNTRENEWLVVWEDYRNMNTDIYGVRLTPKGKKLMSPTSESDTSFAVCKQDSAQYKPRVAYNDLEDTYLVVWDDYRNRKRDHDGVLVNLDVYGQRVTAAGVLMDPGDIPIAFDEYYTETYSDVAYCGTAGKTLNEWLVVFMRYEYGYSSGGSRIWGVRIDGHRGVRLNTWGEEVPVAVGKTMGQYRPPFLPEFVVGWDLKNFYAMLGYHQGSPHAESDDDAPVEGLAKVTGERYPIPEFLVTWTESRKPDQDIYCQRVAYFPDSTAFRLGFKTERGADSLFTAVLLDQNGDWPENPMDWITWPNFLVSPDNYEQTYNNISYCSNDGSYLMIWNDWRGTMWDGQMTDGFVPAADIYGQRAYLNPEDTSLVWIDHDGSWTDLPLNTPIAFTDADEGNHYYPGIAFGTNADAYLIPYEFAETDSTVTSDIVANLYQGAPPVPEDTIPSHPGDIEKTSKPDHFALRQNYPNPFNPDTRIDYVLKSEGQVSLKIFDILGREVVTLVDETQRAGVHQVQWNGRLDGGAQAASGVYIARLTWTKSDKSITLKKKMVLSR